MDYVTYKAEQTQARKAKLPVKACRKAAEAQIPPKISSSAAPAFCGTFALPRLRAAPIDAIIFVFDQAYARGGFYIAYVNEQ